MPGRKYVVGTCCVLLLHLVFRVQLACSDTNNGRIFFRIFTWLCVLCIFLHHIWFNFMSMYKKYWIVRHRCTGHKLWQFSSLAVKVMLFTRNGFLNIISMTHFLVIEHQRSLTILCFCISKKSVSKPSTIGGTRVLLRIVI